MIRQRFIWDDIKNQINKRKHGVSFELAAHVFSDPLHVSVQDRIESGEQRWQTIGMVGNISILLVAHTVTERSDEDGAVVEIIRIISARKATRKERKYYENS